MQSTKTPAQLKCNVPLKICSRNTFELTCANSARRAGRAGPCRLQTGPSTAQCGMLADHDRVSITAECGDKHGELRCEERERPCGTGGRAEAGRAEPSRAEPSRAKAEAGRVRRERDDSGRAVKRGRGCCKREPRGPREGGAGARVRVIHPSMALWWPLTNYAT
jgi:hypothetical protein